ncbi:SGNH/GDSL hydrolase family protein [Ruminococcus sp.]|uniref:SGNH/GDSL hydrolase family protein n=1 Tax=Ruminococcus sp. TaxID=41978 RepID=UPI0025CF5952|nr:SGNH/GDSL hydrolase family protein [Ruminococcus sp.]MBQ8965845.1 GDSL family lipase [Ruminococcus sp.]
MTRRIISLLCAAAVFVGMAGCGAEKSPAPAESAGSMVKEDTGMKGTRLTDENAKLTGRAFPAESGTLWCALSGSGAEFEFTGKNLDIMVEGDGVSQSGPRDNYARIAIYVDGERVVDDLLNEGIKKYTPISGDSVVTKTVKIVKLSETAMSCFGIMPLQLEEGASVKPTAPKAHRIEIIGDSITCGYGVDDEDPTHNFKTSTEDVTKAYSYKTVQALDVDYSLFSISGWGVISGWTGDGTQKPDQQIPLYYEKYGFTYGGFGDTKPQDMDWDFSRFQPELVIINLGTNDDSYCGTNEDRRADYSAGYVEFLKTVRRCNPDARILCVLGIMGDALYPTVEETVAKYSEETGDTNISAFHFEPQKPEDGLAADYHPTEVTHTKAAEALTAEVKSIMGW